MPRDTATVLLPEDILHAYTIGYFPMARTRDDPDVVWVLPEARGVIPLATAHAPRRLLKTLRRAPFEIRTDTAFSAVVRACAAPARQREDTWINDQVFEAYTELHRIGRAHSIEAWRNGALVGGLYGITLGGVFCGESMFSRERDASKIAMLHLIARLRIGGFELLDTQFHTEHLGQFGAVEWPDAAYQATLRRLIGKKTDFYSASGSLSETISVWQSITQTS